MTAATRYERVAGLGEPRILNVYCSQFASCGWKGRRFVTELGAQPKPCPKCGKAVVA